MAYCNDILEFCSPVDTSLLVFCPLTREIFLSGAVEPALFACAATRVPGGATAAAASRDHHDLLLAWTLPNFVCTELAGSECERFIIMPATQAQLDQAVQAALPVSGAAASTAASISLESISQPSLALEASKVGVNTAVEDAAAQVALPIVAVAVQPAASAVAPPQADSSSTAPQQQGAAAAAQSQPSPPPPPLDDGSDPCSICGAARAQLDAAFCHRCGHPLWATSAKEGNDAASNACASVQEPPGGEPHHRHRSAPSLRRSLDGTAVAAAGTGAGKHISAVSLAKAAEPRLPERPPIRADPWPNADRPQPLGFGSTAPQRHGLSNRGDGASGKQHRKAPAFPAGTSRALASRQPRTATYLDLVLEEADEWGKGAAEQPPREQRPPRPNHRHAPTLVQPRMVFGGGRVAPARNQYTGHRQPPSLPPGAAVKPLDGQSNRRTAPPPPPTAINRYLHHPSAGPYRAPPILAGDIAAPPLLAQGPFIPSSKAAAPPQHHHHHHHHADQHPPAMAHPPPRTRPPPQVDFRERSACAREAERLRTTSILAHH